MYCAQLISCPKKNVGNTNKTKWMEFFSYVNHDENLFEIILRSKNGRRGKTFSIVIFAKL